MLFLYKKLIINVRILFQKMFFRLLNCCCWFAVIFLQHIIIFNTYLKRWFTVWMNSGLSINWVFTVNINKQNLKFCNTFLISVSYSYYYCCFLLSWKDSWWYSELSSMLNWKWMNNNMKSVNHLKEKQLK